MTAKEWLFRARDKDKEINAIVKAKQAAYDRCTSITAKLKTVSVSGGGDVHDKMDYWAEISAELERHEKDLSDTYAEIMRVIWRVKDARLRTLLINYYLNQETWEQVAVDMSKSYVYVVHYLHPQALQAVEKILKDSGLI